MIKLLFSLALFILGLSSASSAQQLNVSVLLATSKLYASSSDSISSRKVQPPVLKFDTLNRIDDTSVEIPNAFQRLSELNSYHYTMPIKKLSGANLAPMPGTEALNKLENQERIQFIEPKNLQDSLKDK
ncbi:hypothetical protein [Sphingobacterium hungaricum]|uniref:Uncharacterized protein n=1 Tax=Sphingobacterium hungaricum TaxID=2082723 RepID=A0A928UY97_9SPHI|nr:hypothetical protein [Sphingobacterium hungaricum]MBE8713585.1 hypothetical protein [Sphingobacterium hungaricum]